MRVAGIFLSSIRGSYASDLADCLAAELLDKRVRIVAIVTEQRLAWKDFLEYVRLYHLDTAIVHYSVEIRDDGGAPPPVQTIFINHIPTERENCYYINFDYPHAVGLALRHLLNRGHADIAFLACQSSSFINQSVLSAAHETCRQYGLAFDDGHFWTIDDTYSRDELVRQLGACFRRIRESPRSSPPRRAPPCTSWTTSASTTCSSRRTSPSSRSATCTSQRSFSPTSRGWT